MLPLLEGKLSDKSLSWQAKLARTAFPDNIGFSSILGYETMGCETKGRRKLHTRIFPRNDVKDREDCNKMQNLGKVLMIAVALVCC